MKELSGANIAAYMKENQAHTVKALRSNKVTPKLVIIRDNNAPVIEKYVALKKRYGDDIGVQVEDWCGDEISDFIHQANNDPSVHGVIVQLPLRKVAATDHIIDEIIPEKDVDGLSNIADDKVIFDSATATAINWLLAAYDVDLAKEKIALVGRGRLIGAPLERMWGASGYDVTVFHRGSNLNELINYDLIVSATGVPRLIKSEMIKPGAIVVDAGTASEGGVLVGDVDEEVRERTDLEAITPKIGGVGPLTVTALFEHVLIAARNSLK